MAEECLFCLLGIALGNREVSEYPSVDNATWQEIFHLSKKHAVCSVVFGAVEKLPENVRPHDTQLILKWYALTAQTEKRNEKMNLACEQLARDFSSIGLQAFVIKGQSMAKLYPEPLRRTSGDIDVLTLPTEEILGVEQRIDHVCKAVNRLGGEKVGHVVYHHAEWRMGDVPVEIHFRPMYLNNPWHNRRFQKWSGEVYDTFKHSENGFNSPSLKFDLVYLLLHIYHHLLFEGVGLRQVCDYAVILNQLEHDKAANSLRNNTVSTLKKLGLTKFVRGLMWVLQKTCGIKDEMLLLKTDEKTGRFILNEIMQAGNMGQHDERINRSHSVALNRTLHRLRFLRMVPQEILWDIPFRIWHKCWRTYCQQKYGWT